jgi:cyanophycin synthetase
MVEKQINAPEYRFFSTPKKTLAVAWRQPAHVIGDGVHSIRQLISKKNKEEGRVKKDEAQRDTFRYAIVIDKALRNYIALQGKKLVDIPKKDELVWLRGNSNLSTGGDAVDMTKVMHPSYKKIAQNAVKAFHKAPYAGVDILIQDYTKPATKNKYHIIEINDSPGVGVHFTPTLHRIDAIAIEMIDQIFPETKGKTQHIVKSFAKDVRY